MTYENYPQEITADEKSLGFELLALESYGLPWETIPPLSYAAVVAIRLSPFDVVVKSIVFGDLVYIHKRFGRDSKVKESRTEWWPMSDGNQDARQAIEIAKAGYATSPYAKEIVPIPFQYRPA